MTHLKRTATAALSCQSNRPSRAYHRANAMHGRARAPARPGRLGGGNDRREGAARAYKRWALDVPWSTARCSCDPSRGTACRLRTPSSRTTSPRIPSSDRASCIRSSSFAPSSGRSTLPTRSTWTTEQSLKRRIGNIIHSFITDSLDALVCLKVRTRSSIVVAVVVS